MPSREEIVAALEIAADVHILKHGEDKHAEGLLKMARQVDAMRCKMCSTMMVNL